MNLTDLLQFGWYASWAAFVVWLVVLIGIVFSHWRH